MNPALETAATTYIAPKFVRNFKVRWIFYGIAAYYGLKYLNQRGILPKVTDKALDKIDKGMDIVKRQVGLGETTVPESSLHH